MRRIATAFALAVLSAWAPVAQERADPYQVTTVCTSVPINIGRRIAVASGGELQQALDAAVSGDTILLAPGALFTPTAPESSFRLRNRPIAEGQWVVVRSAHAAFDADGEVAPHTRLEPSRADLSITHVTSLGNARNILKANGLDDRNPRFVFAYNIVERKTYGIGAGGDEGMKTLTRNFSPCTYRQNLVVNTSKGSGPDVSNAVLEARYPATTMVASDWSDVGFANGPAGLAPTSRYAGIADNGRDLGASVVAITNAQARVVRDADGCSSAIAIPRKRAGKPANP